MVWRMQQTPLCADKNFVRILQRSCLPDAHSRQYEATRTKKEDRDPKEKQIDVRGRHAMSEGGLRQK